MRTSSGTWISRFSSDPAIKKFVTRASNWIGKSPYHSESVQVLQYDLTQEYKPHPDYFDPKRLPHYLKNGGQRIASVMVFFYSFFFLLSSHDIKFLFLGLFK